mmetsp:Transcript_30831/g.65210  ORF Transcript_30831/g.65210 Transcript_30831/m.65210 type:complete len:407 (+) Transcript_30831:141-1361(+)
MKISYSLLITASAALFYVRPVAAVGDCGCSSCTSSVLNQDADGYSVRDRIDWVVANMGESEREACTIVCGDEFSSVCGDQCDPNQCSDSGGQSKCGCSSCTASVLGRDADGYSVGNRIDWVVANMGQSEQGACSAVCGDEFPDVCGECNPTQCGGSGGGGSKCGCSSCTDSVLGRDANGYSVGSRIDWLVANTGQSEQGACSTVCKDEFPSICGECNPSQCGGGGGGGATAEGASNNLDGTKRRKKKRIKRSTVHHEATLVAASKLGLWEEALLIFREVEHLASIDASYNDTGSTNSQRRRRGGTTRVTDNMILSVISACVKGSRVKRTTAPVPALEIVPEETAEKEEEEEEESALGTLGKHLGHLRKTTTAKINQDRGGIAYPYGNSEFQALFAVYDGHGEGGSW